MEQQEKIAPQEEPDCEKIPEESTENVSRGTINGVHFSFDARYDDIFDGLDATDTADGTNKKTRTMYLIITILMLFQIVWFAYSGSGFALIFAVVMGALALLLKKRSQRFNKEIAKAFEDEGKQTVIFEEDSLKLNEKTVPYSEVSKVYELKRCFSIIYQGNHVYIIPKNVLDEAQTEEFVAAVKEKAETAYRNMLKK